MLNTGGPMATSPPDRGKSLCDVCREKPSKYCCPRCDRKTCSLECVNAHKETENCSGKRDRTAYLSRKELGDRSLLSDYRFLEEVKLAGDAAKRSKPPAPKHELPHFLQSLVHQARRRGVELHLLAPGMERRRCNTTKYDGKHQLLSWRVEWIFASADNCKAVNTRISENTPLRGILEAHLTPPPGASLKTPELQCYADLGVDRLTVLMKKERTPANAPAYYRIDKEKNLKVVLEGKAIVEFPVFLVLTEEEVGKYPAAFD